MELPSYNDLDVCHISNYNNKNQWHLREWPNRLEKKHKWYYKSVGIKKRKCDWAMQKKP